MAKIVVMGISTRNSYVYIVFSEILVLFANLSILINKFSKILKIF
jgi:hypothetical protein